MPTTPMTCKCSSRPNISPIPQPGDICAVENTSVVLPFLELIVAAMGPKALHKAVKDRNKRRNPAGNSGKPARPCIILPDETEPTENGRICLMATFEGAGPTSTSFPNIYKEFIVPMVPNSANDGFGEPLHSCPGWVSKKNQWIIAAPIFPIVGTSRDLQKWNVSLEYHLCDDSVLDLAGICDDKMADWEEKLEANSFNIAAEYYRDLKGKRKDWFSTKSQDTETTIQSSKYSESFISMHSVLEPIRGLFGKSSPHQVGPSSRQQRPKSNPLDYLHRSVLHRNSSADTQASPMKTEPSFSDADWPSLSKPSRSISAPLNHIEEDSAAEHAASHVESKSPAPHLPPQPSSPVPMPDEAVTKQMSKLQLKVSRRPSIRSFMKKVPPSPRSLSSNRVPSLRAVPCDPVLSETLENPGWALQVEALKVTGRKR